MSLFGEIHPLFPEKQGIGARKGLILGVPKKGGSVTKYPPMLWCLTKTLMSHIVPDRNICFVYSRVCPSRFFLLLPESVV
jgi:hypothetical protein